MKLELKRDGLSLKVLDLVSRKEVSLGRDQQCEFHIDDRSVSRKQIVFRLKGDRIEAQKLAQFADIHFKGQKFERVLLGMGDAVEFGRYRVEVLQEIIENVKDQSGPRGADHPDGADELHVETLQGEESQPIQVASLSDHPNSSESFLDSPSEEAPASQDENPGLSLHEGMGLEGSVDSAPSETPIVESTRVIDSDSTRISSQSVENLKTILEFGELGSASHFYEITQNETTLGREPPCHVLIGDRKASRQHAMIRKTETGVYLLVDLKSANGTFINDERIDERVLNSGDLIRIGDTQFSFKQVQPDYEIKAQSFMPVAQEDYIPPLASQGQIQDLSLMGQAPVNDIQFQSADPQAADSEDLITRLRNRYRAMTTRQQIIYGLVAIGVVYLAMDELFPEPVDNTPAKLVMPGQVKKVDAKKNEAAMKPRFESLSPEQQKYIETQYQIAFEYYKAREYDKCLLDIGKVIAIIPDYKNAKEIEAFAREGKRKLAILEEERKRKEQERTLKLKLEGLIQDAEILMSQKRFEQAEVLFTEIELLQPENSNVSTWRRQILEEEDRRQREALETARVQALNNAARKYLAHSAALEEKGSYLAAIDELDIALEKEIPDSKLKKEIKNRIDSIEKKISELRDPLVQKGIDAEKQDLLVESYRAFEEAHAIDPDAREPREGMERLRAALVAKAKAIFQEGVFAENFSDQAKAMEKYEEVLKVAPRDDDYYRKAETKLKRLKLMKQ